MKYENLLASRYIKAQKRQSVFTCVSIIAAVAVMTMIFVLYSVSMDCLENTCYSRAPYHLTVTGLTEQQGEAICSTDHIKRGKLERTPDNTVTAYILFGSDMGDREIWIQKALQNVGAEHLFYDLPKKYDWNNTLMNLDGIGDGAQLFRLRIFCIFFIFAILIAFALRMIIDTAFEVSSKERERHYGVLQSIGATPEQIVRIITYEGFRLCVIAIPFGLIAGICFAYLMYHVVLASGISELFQGMSNAKLALPFSVDPKMLLVAAVVGIVWVFLSAYGVGMRIIKKTPMEAISARANNVEKIKKRTLSGLLFGVSGSIASRNARREKKRFAITVLTLTVSITMFALFSTLTETAERSINGYIKAEVYEFNEEAADIDFELEIGNPQKGISYAEAVKALQDSGLFENIAVDTFESFHSTENKGNIYARYVNREAYTQLFGRNAAVSYDELVSTGGYVYNINCKDYEQNAEQLQRGSLPVFSICMHLREDADTENMDYIDLLKYAEYEEKEQTLDILDSVSMKNEYDLLIGAIETHEKIGAEWFGMSFGTANAKFCFAGSSADDYQYNAADYKKAKDWFEAHSEFDFVRMLNPDEPENNYGDFYGIKWKTHSILATVRAGVLMLNLLLALAALINLLNIISTGIANRRSELASLQCVGMTDRQLDRMAIIECLQFAGAAAIISAVICAVIIFGAEGVLNTIIRDSFVDESEETKKMLMNLVRIDHITPFMRVGFSALAAFAAGCITSLVMLRTQNRDSLTDQIRGSEMKLDTEKSHILRNSILAAAGAFILAIAGLRIYSVAAYHRDRNEYAKAGYLNLADANGFKMNVYSTGAEHGKHTIVGLAGQASYAFPVETTKLNELLGKENTLVYPDCAGYGFSGDSLKPQTVEQIVEDYRAGLKNAGFEAPYVLMPHSIADLYALYWSMQYPDEVEAIIILDGTIPPKSELWQTYTAEEAFPSDEAAQAAMHKLVLRTWLGLNRLFPDKSEGGATQGAALFTDEQLRLSKLCNNRFWTAAFSSQILLEKQEVTHMGEILCPTDTPKLYFSTLYTCEEDVRAAIERMKADFEAEGKEFNSDPETAARAEWKQVEWEIEQAKSEENDFAEKIGNCRLEYVAGDHGIFYAQKPEQIASSILDFLAETTE